MGTWKLSHAPCSQFFLGTEAHLAASIIKLDFLMCSNFLLHLAKPSRCQSQSLSDDCPYSQILFGRLPLAACTSTQHQVRGCISTHPLPNLNFILMTAGCWVATAGRTSRPCQNPDTGCRCTEWHRVPSPHWHGSPPGHLVPLEHVPVTHCTRLPAGHSPLLKPSNQLRGSRCHLLTSLSSTMSYLLPRNDPVGPPITDMPYCSCLESVRTH